MTVFEKSAALLFSLRILKSIDMKSILILLTGISIFLIVGCSSTGEPPTEAAITKYQNVKWILGDWQNETPKSNKVFTQNFEEVGKYKMKGIFEITEGGKRTFFETLEISLDGDDLIYIVDGPKIKKPIQFILTESDFKKFKVENPENDYPTAIEYESSQQNFKMTTRTLGGGKRVDYNFFSVAAE